MEHGSIITQARREDALVLTKQGRGATSQNFALPPGGEGAEDPAGTGGSVGSRAPVGTRTPVGAERGPGCQRPAGGCHPRSCHPSGHPSPREQAETPGARVAPGHPRRPHPSRGDGVVTPPPHRCTPAPGPRGGHEGSRAGTPPGPEFSCRTGMPGRSAVAARGLGTKFTGPRLGGGGGGKAAVRAERGTLAVRLSKQAGPEAGPEPLPAPCAPPGPPLRAHTHSRVCLARERCPWLHNSPDGIRPSVFLNRAAKKVRVVYGQRLATPRLIGGWVGLEQTGASSGPL